MTGQGRPHIEVFYSSMQSQNDCFGRLALRLFGFLALTVVILLQSSVCLAQTENKDLPKNQAEDSQPSTPPNQLNTRQGDKSSRTTLRLAWGGRSYLAWGGQIEVPGGKIISFKTLGRDADTPGSMWLKDGVLHIERRSKRSYDGVDIVVEGEQNAKIITSLASEADMRPVAVEASIASLRTQAYRATLDSVGNYLLIHRAPGDAIRTTFERNALIFRPQEEFVFQVEIDMPQESFSDSMSMDVVVQKTAGGETLWSETYNVTESMTKSASLTVKLPMPEKEGVYDIILSVREKSSYSKKWVPYLEAKAIAQRHIQVVVFDPDRIKSSVTQEWTHIANIDPTNPRWWSRLPEWMRVEKLPGLPKGPLSNQSLEYVTKANNKYLKLANRTNGKEPSWWAFPLPVEEIGIPHILEIEISNEGAIDLGVSILEPNASGKVIPIDRDFGFHANPIISASRGTSPHKYRVIYWPKTTAPVLVLTNLQPNSSVLVGKMVISCSKNGLPNTQLATNISRNHRLTAAYINRPFLPASFGCNDIRDPITGQPIQNWQTFYDSGTRMADYLRFTGYNAAIVSVLSDGGAIYPSHLTGTTVRFDSGQLATSGSDPIQKDILELMLQTFDRAGLAFVPAIHLNATLPALEAAKRKTRSQESGLEWIGPDGRTYLEVYGAERGSAPHYNLLHPEVQHAFLQIIEELATRCGSHPSFSGIAIQFSGHASTQLPGLEWGMDDQTVKKFSLDTGIQVPGKGKGKDRFRARTQFLLGESRDAWTTWRVKQVSDFYKQVQKVVSKDNPRRATFLLFANILEGSPIRARLQPTLLQQASFRSGFRELGLDLEVLGTIPGIVATRPYYQLPLSKTTQNAPATQLAKSSELTKLQSLNSRMGIQIDKRSQQILLPSLGSQSPFGPETISIARRIQTKPSGQELRRIFTHAIIDHDTSILIDGGGLMDTSFDPALKRLLTIYQRLPLPNKQVATKEVQPVTVRTYEEQDATIICAINDSPWPIRVKMPLLAPAGCISVDLVGTTRPRTVPNGASGMAWTVELEPYGIYAARFSEKGVRVQQIQFEVTQAEIIALEQEIEALGERVSLMARQREYRALKNPGFEALAQQAPVENVSSVQHAKESSLGTEFGSIQGWKSTSAGEGFTFTLDTQKPFSGKISAKMTSVGASGSVSSHSFDAPETGRLTLQLRLRSDAIKDQPVFRVAIESLNAGKEYNQYIVFGGKGKQAVPISKEWGYYSFTANRLPLGETTKLRVRFDLLGKGKVWIDDIKLLDLSLIDQPQFHRSERVGLDKIRYQAAATLNKKRYRDTLRVLEGHWPVYLKQHIQLPKRETKTVEVPITPTTEQPGVASRMKEFIPPFLRR